MSTVCMLFVLCCAVVDIVFSNWIQIKVFMLPNINVIYHKS